MHSLLRLLIIILAKIQAFTHSAPILNVTLTPNPTSYSSSCSCTSHRLSLILRFSGRILRTAHARVSHARFHENITSFRFLWELRDCAPLCGGVCVRARAASHPASHHTSSQQTLDFLSLSQHSLTAAAGWSSCTSHDFYIWLLARRTASLPRVDMPLNRHRLKAAAA